MIVATVLSAFLLPLVGCEKTIKDVRVPVQPADALAAGH
jgi:hypothetical protein